MNKIICEQCGCEVTLTDKALGNLKCPICGYEIQYTNVAPEKKLFVLGDQGLALPSLTIISCYENHIELLNKKTREIKHSILFSQITDIKANDFTSKITFMLTDGNRVAVKIATQFAPSSIVKQIKDVMNKN